MSATEQLKLLHELQLVDLEIMEIEQFRDVAPERIAKLEAEIKAHEKNVEERQESLKALQGSRRAKEKELVEHEARVEKNKERLMAVKTNEEYHAIQKENDAQKVFVEELEDAILRLMDDIDGAELALRKAKDRFGDLEKKLQVQMVEIKAQLAEVPQRLEVRIEARAVVMPKIDELFLDRYTKLRKRTGGIAVVRVIKRTCQGCLMNIPPQTYNLVIRNEDIITCPNCYRILYYEEAMDRAAEPTGG